LDRDRPVNCSGLSIGASSRPHVYADGVDITRLDRKRLGALAHPIRVHILQAAEVDAVSPSDIAVEIGEPLGVVAYHFRVLHNVDLIELTATERRRGSIESFYRSTASGWQGLASTLIGMVGEESPSPDP
jgi:hypothetical protein